MADPSKQTSVCVAAESSEENKVTSHFKKSVFFFFYSFGLLPHLCLVKKFNLCVFSPCRWGPCSWPSKQSVGCWRAGGGFAPGWPPSWIPVRSAPRWASSPAPASSLPRPYTCPGSPPPHWTPACPGWTRYSAPAPPQSASTSPCPTRKKRLVGFILVQAGNMGIRGG